MEEAVVVTDKWGFITLFNERAVALTGWKPPKAIGKALGQVIRFLDGATRQPILLPFHEALLQPSSNNDEETILRSISGTETRGRFSLSSMVGDDGEVNGVIIKFHPEKADASKSPRRHETTRQPSRSARSAPPL
jgi:PAS domain-containing protein